MVAPVAQLTLPPCPCSSMARWIERLRSKEKVPSSSPGRSAKGGRVKIERPEAERSSLRGRQPCLPRIKICVCVPVAQWIERFPAEEEASRSNRLGDANFQCGAEAEIEVQFLVGAP